MTSADRNQHANKTYSIATGRLVAMIVLALFWLNGTYAFLLQFGMNYAQFVARFGNPVTLLSEVTIIALGIVLMRKRSDIFLSSGFMLLTFIVTVIVNDGTVQQWFNGIRFYSGFLFIVPILRFLTDTPARHRYFIHLMDRSLYIFLWLQGPAMIWQLIYYGGWDYGGGTYGVMYSGQISTIIFVISFYLMLKRWDPELNYGKNVKKNWILVFLLYPSFLNETKITFIFLILYFLLLVPIDRKFIKNILIVTPITIAFIGISFWIYTQIYGTQENNMDIFSTEYFEYYMFGDDVMLDVIEMAFENSNDFEYDMQRGIKFAALPMVMDRQPSSWIYGYGIGQIKGSSIENPTPFYREYTWLVDGTFMSIALLLIESGILGIIWMVLFLIGLFRGKSDKLSRNKQLTVFMVILTIMMLSYNTSLSMIQFYIPFFYIAFFTSHWNMVSDVRSEELEYQAMDIKHKADENTACK